MAQLDVIIDSEITSRDGDIVGLFLKENVPAGLSAAETVQAIHAQSGLAIAVHPYSFLLPTIVKGVRGYILSVDFDGLETRNGTPTELLSNYVAQRINQRRELPEVGGSDAHYLPTVGQTYTRFPGRTAADFRRAIEKGESEAGGQVYGWFTLAQVAALSVLGYRSTAEPSRVRSLV